MRDKNRDDFNLETKNVLAKRVCYRCSNPNCRKPTTAPKEDAAKAISIGVAAHITAASTGGPRFNPLISPEDRKSSDNGIWLCQNCARLIDSDENRYTVELVRKWKDLSEQIALLEVENNSLPEDNTHNSDSVEQFKNNGSGSQINIGNTAIGNQTIYNQQTSEYFDEIKNGRRTTYRRDPVTGAIIVTGIGLV